MTLLYISLKRINLFLQEIKKLRKIEFAYDDSEAALLKLKKHFENHKYLLESFSGKSDKSIVEKACTNSLYDLWIYLPLLGFILRSTNVRNAFELYRPFLRLSKDILKISAGNNIHLILSSEWVYSPITYIEVPAFPDFVLMGLPAHESGNPLLIPLAGHELGHHVWFRERTANVIESKLNDIIVDFILQDWETYRKIFPNVVVKKDKTEFYNNLYTPPTWASAKTYSLKQAEETFCDFIGLRLFRKSYLQAFTYFIAPDLSMMRSPYYPKTKTRIKNLLLACKVFGIDCDSDSYLSMFCESHDPVLSEGDAFQLKISDATLGVFVSELISIVEGLIDSPDYTDEISQIVLRFNNVVPAENCKSLVSIVEAAWQFYDTNIQEGMLWKILSHLGPDQQEQIFEDLVLKSIEVFEFEQILQD